jgi:agmatine deiminase
MSQLLPSTPAADGFRMPAEFEPHDGTWMLWPERPDNWRNGARPAQQAFTAVARAIAGFEPVTVGVNQRQYDNARSTLPPQVRVVEISSNDSWMRDCGATFLTNGAGAVRGVNWKFNAWGGVVDGLYFPWDLDDLAAVKMLEIERMDRYDAPLILEGGSIHSDGDGTLYTTEQCLLNPNRNPGLARSRIEGLLGEYLGIHTVIWLGEGLINDETDGHIDNLVAPLRPGVVALAWTDDPNDPQHAISRDALERLTRTRDARGRTLEIVKLHIPSPQLITTSEAEGVDRVQGTLPRVAGDRMAASYVNFYTCNGGVIVPLFGDPRDVEAIEILSRAMPERRVVGVAAREILLGGGNIHCITQQQPAGRRN